MIPETARQQAIQDENIDHDIDMIMANDFMVSRLGFGLARFDEIMGADEAVQTVKEL